MTFVNKIMQYNNFLSIAPVFKCCILCLKFRKSDNFVHNIHPGPFDPYTLLWLIITRT